MSLDSTLNYFVKNVLNDYDNYHQFSNDELARNVMNEVSKKVPDAFFISVGKYQFICLTAVAYDKFIAHMNNIINKMLNDLDVYQSAVNQVNPFGG